MIIDYLSISAFRGIRQTADLSLHRQLNLAHGSNSLGKTSIAEAVEFLLTGQTARRDKIGTTKHEFADALRASHAEHPTVVTAIITPDSTHPNDKVHIRRTLAVDYGNTNAPCQSCFERLADPTDPDTWQETDLAAIGLPQWNDPLQLPILFQHTLRYVANARPSERRDYFRALLDVQDITELRDTVAEAIADFNSEELPPAYRECLTHIAALLDIPTTREFAQHLKASRHTSGDIEEKLRRHILEELRRLKPEVAPDDRCSHTELRNALADALEELSEAETGLPSLLPPDPTPPHTSPQAIIDVMQPLADTLAAAADTYERDNEIIADQLEQMIPFLAAGESLPQFQQIPLQSQDCPFCLTPHAVTPDRIEDIRLALQRPQQIQAVREAVIQAIGALRESLSSLENGLANQIPIPVRAVTEEALLALLPAEGERIERWLRARDEYLGHISSLTRRVAAAIAILERMRERARFGRPLPTFHIRQLLTDTRQRLSELFEARRPYAAEGHALGPEVAARAAELSGLTAWTHILYLLDNIDTLVDAIIESRARQVLAQDLTEALDQITRETSAVLRDDKFPQLSRDVADWWQVLRPAERINFDSVSPRGNALRDIDLLATIQPSAGDPVSRSAVAIFSDSQLNALGLAVFFARTCRRHDGFVILDDPVQSLDSEHRDHITRCVIERLLQRGVQVFLLTHDESFWDDVRTLHVHLDPKAFRVHEEPTGDPIVRDTQSELHDLFLRIDQLRRISDPNTWILAVNHLRTATENLCKALICKNELGTLPSAFDGWMLPRLLPRAIPHLELDRSHPGKLRYAERRTNPGSHDSLQNAPGDAAVGGILGDLRMIAREYGL